VTRAEFAALERRVAGELRALEEKAAARVKRARARHSRADMEADARAAGVDAGGKSAKEVRRLVKVSRRAEKVDWGGMAAAFGEAPAGAEVQSGGCGGRDGGRDAVGEGRARERGGKRAVPAVAAGLEGGARAGERPETPDRKRPKNKVGAAGGRHGVASAEAHASVEESVGGASFEGRGDGGDERALDGAAGDESAPGDEAEEEVLWSDASLAAGSGEGSESLDGGPSEGSGSGSDPEPPAALRSRRAAGEERGFGRQGAAPTGDGGAESEPEPEAQPAAPMPSLRQLAKKLAAAAQAKKGRLVRHKESGAPPEPSAGASTRHRGVARLERGGGDADRGKGGGAG